MSFSCQTKKSEDSQEKKELSQTELLRRKAEERMRNQIHTLGYENILPINLRKILMDDYELLRTYNLPRIPSPVTIDTMVKDYLRTTLSNDWHSFRRNDASILLDRFNGYFGRRFVYGLELQDYKALTLEIATKNSFPRDDLTGHCPNFCASAYYGVVHFLRWANDIVKVLQSELTDKNHDTTTSIINNLKGFLVFIGQHIGNYYDKSTYYMPGPPIDVRDLNPKTMSLMTVRTMEKYGAAIGSYPV